MSNKNMEDHLPDEIILNKIVLIRGQKVMLDSDLALLYGVETKQLKRQVKRNIARFPNDFMFELTTSEYESLRSHFGTLKQGTHTKYLPFVFTEQGIAMLSSVLNSETAIKINIQIIRIFYKIRELLQNHKEIFNKLNELETKIGNQDKNIRQLFAYLKELSQQEEIPRKRIGFYK